MITTASEKKIELLKSSIYESIADEFINKAALI